MGRYSALGWMVSLLLVIALPLLAQECWLRRNLASSDFSLESMPFKAGISQAGISQAGISQVAASSLQQPGEPGCVADHPAETRKPGLPGNEEVFVAIPRPPRQDTADPELVKRAKQVAQANNQFAFDLFQQIRGREGNLFFSPASISTALAMTSAGARGKTQREMSDVLHLPTQAETHQGYSALLEMLGDNEEENEEKEERVITLRIANRLWGSSTTKFEPDFLQVTRGQYQADLVPMNFHKSEQARQTINDWVAHSTGEKIKDMIPEGVIDSAHPNGLDKCDLLQG